MADRVTVNTKSAMESKINWTQIAGIAASLAAFFGLDVSPQTLVSVVVGIQAFASVLTMVWKTWFTNTVTPESAK